MDKEKKPRTKRFYTPKFLAAKNALDVWASYTLARRERSECPNMQAIFGDTTTKITVWKNKSTGALLVQPDKPEGKAWKVFDVEDIQLPSTSENMNSIVAITAMAVEVCLRANMPRDEWEAAKVRLLWVYPRTGIYEKKETKMLDKYSERLAWDSMHNQVLKIINNSGVSTDRLR